MCNNVLRRNQQPHGLGVERARSGMTLIEVIVALTLATFLMAAVLGVLASLNHQRRVLLGRRPPQAWQGQLRRQLKRDLENARRISSRWDELRLVGYGGTDPATGMPTHRPTEVVYRVRRVGETPWLVRWEIHLDELTNRNLSGDLVCSGVRALEVLGTDASAEPMLPAEAIDTRLDATIAAPVLLTAMPDDLRLVLFGVEGEPFMLDETYYLR